MKTEGDRFNFIQEQSGLSKKDFAESLGLSKSHGYHISKGETRASRDVLERLSKLYKVNLNWFISGEGESGRSEETAGIVLLDQEAAAGQGRLSLRRGSG